MAKSYTLTLSEEWRNVQREAVRLTSERSQGLGLRLRGGLLASDAQLPGFDGPA